VLQPAVSEAPTTTMVWNNRDRTRARPSKRRTS
jgi:hypothetical protein